MAGVPERTVLQPLRVGGTTALRNRLYRAPVLEGAGDGDDAAAVYAKQLVANAAAGVGLIIQGNSCLYDEGRTSPGMTIVSTRERMLRLAPMVDAVHAAGAAIWIQVGLGGLFAMEAWHEPYAIALCRLVEEFGYDSVTPVQVSVFPDTTLSRGGIPTSIWKNQAMQKRFRAAAPRRTERAVLVAGYVFGGATARFQPVWNRSRFVAVKAAVDIPVLTVGGIRDTHEVDGILDGGQADLVGIGRPFYAEPDLPERILGGRPEPGLCQYSNLCVPAQMLGMKGACYNPAVTRARRAGDSGRTDSGR